MELKLQNGDYVADGTGGLQRVSGREELLQRVLYKLTARRGMFPFLEELGSRLWQLGRVGAAQRQSAAEQYVAEALAGEEGLTVESVTLTPCLDGAITVTVELLYSGEMLSVTLELS